MRVSIDQPWLVVKGTQERMIRHRDTGQVIEFSDDPADTRHDREPLGLADLIHPDDLRRLRRLYTDYEIASGGV